MQIEKEFKLERSVSSLKEILTNLKKFGAYHPLIQKVIYDDRFDSFIVKEKPFSFIPVSFSYTCIVEEEEERIIYHVNDIPFVKLKMDYSFKTIDRDHTELVLKINLGGPKWITKLMAKKMMEAQNILWDQVKAYT